MVKKVQIFFFCAIALILLTMAALLGLISYKNGKPHIAFYNVEEPVQETILEILNSNRLENKKKPYEKTVLDKNIPLSCQQKAFKNCTLIFAQADYDFAEFCASSKKVKKLSINLLDGMPSTIQKFVPATATASIQSMSFQNQIPFVPILFDFYQIDVNYQAFKEEGININTWDDFSKFLNARIPQNPAPLFFAGNDEKNFLAICGMLAEALSSNNDAPQKYEDFCRNLYNACKSDFKTQDSNSSLEQNLNQNSNNQNLRAVLENECVPNGFLYEALKQIALLIKNKNLSSSTFHLSPQELNFYLENSLSVSAFLTLSEHRKIDRKIIGQYSSIYCPSTQDRISRKFVAPCICTASLKAPLKNKAEIQKELNLLSNLKQTELSTKTGLCPVQKNSSVADHQADDVRYWIAASDGPLMPLYAALPYSQARSFCASFILDHINHLEGDF